MKCFLVILLAASSTGSAAEFTITTSFDSLTALNTRSLSTGLEARALKKPSSLYVDLDQLSNIHKFKSIGENVAFYEQSRERRLRARLYRRAGGPFKSIADRFSKPAALKLSSVNKYSYDKNQRKVVPILLPKPQPRPNVGKVIQEKIKPVIESAKNLAAGAKKDPLGAGIFACTTIGKICQTSGKNTGNQNLEEFGNTLLDVTTKYATPAKALSDLINTGQQERDPNDSKGKKPK